MVLLNNIMIIFLGCLLTLAPKSTAQILSIELKVIEISFLEKLTIEVGVENISTANIYLNRCVEPNIFIQDEIPIQIKVFNISENVAFSPPIKKSMSMINLDNKCFKKLRGHDMFTFEVDLLENWNIREMIDLNEGDEFRIDILLNIHYKLDQNDTINVSRHYFEFIELNPSNCSLRVRE